jgi:hypothetical protein
MSRRAYVAGCSLLIVLAFCAGYRFGPLFDAYNDWVRRRWVETNSEHALRHLSDPNSDPGALYGSAKFLGLEWQQLRPEQKRLAVPALMALLRNPEPSVQKEAAWALGSAGPDATEAVPALLECWRGTDDRWVRDVTAEALRAVDPEAARRAGVPGG